MTHKKIEPTRELKINYKLQSVSDGLLLLNARSEL